MATDFMKAKLNTYTEEHGVSFSGTAFYKPSRNNQPDYVGTGAINFRGEIVPVEIAVWQNTKSIKIKGTKK